MKFFLLCLGLISVFAVYLFQRFVYSNTNFNPVGRWKVEFRFAGDESMLYDSTPRLRVKAHSAARYRLGA